MRRAENRPYEYVLGFIGFLVAVALVFHDSLKEFIPEIISAVSVLFAAFFGASFAFLLNSKKLQDEKDDKNVAAGNRANFVLIAMHNAFSNYKINHLDRNKDNKLYFIEAPTTSHPMTFTQKIDYDSISFLLGTEYQNTPGRMSIVESWFNTVINEINNRNQMQISVVQPAIEEVSKDIYDTHTMADVEKILGQKTFFVMKRSMEDIYHNVTEVLIDIEKTSVELSNAIKTLYPNHSILGLDPRKMGSGNT